MEKIPQALAPIFRRAHTSETQNSAEAEFCDSDDESRRERGGGKEPPKQCKFVYHILTSPH
jgi:hypothetical protein